MLDEARMSGIQQAVQTLPLPQQPDVDPGTQLGRNTLQRVNRESVDMPALDPPDNRPGDAGTDTELRLCHATSHPQRAHAQPEPDDVHRGSIAMVDAPPRVGLP